MANEHGYERTYKVYRIVRVAKVEDFKEAYGLVYVRSCENEDDAEQWIIQEGERNTDYTYIEVFRNK